MQFGVKPLFENISVKFRDGNRYGLIGANGSGKSTFMKILDGTQTPTSGQISLDSNQRIGKLNQNQFEFEEFKVLDTVIMGHKQLWEIKKERDRIYSLPEMTENVVEMVGRRYIELYEKLIGKKFVISSSYDIVKRINKNLKDFIV